MCRLQAFPPRRPGFPGTLLTPLPTWRSLQPHPRGSLELRAPGGAVPGEPVGDHSGEDPSPEGKGCFPSTGGAAALTSGRPTRRSARENSRTAHRVHRSTRGAALSSRASEVPRELPTRAPPPSAGGASAAPLQVESGANRATWGLAARRRRKRRFPGSQSCNPEAEDRPHLPGPAPVAPPPGSGSHLARRAEASRAAVCLAGGPITRRFCPDPSAGAAPQPQVAGERVHSPPPPATPPPFPWCRAADLRPRGAPLPAGRFSPRPGRRGGCRLSALLPQRLEPGSGGVPSPSLRAAGRRR